MGRDEEIVEDKMIDNPTKPRKLIDLAKEVNI